MNPLTILPFLFLTSNQARIDSKYFQTNINNYQTPIFSTGQIRAGTLNNNLFLNREGLLNATAGLNTKIKKVKSFYTITQSKTKTRQEQPNLISEMLTDNQIQDIGIYFKKIGYEYSQSNKNLEGKVILNFGNQISIEKFNEKLTQTSQMANLGIPHGYFKLIQNQTKCNKEIATEYKTISSVDYKYLNWTFDGEHNLYLSSETKPITFFVFSDGKLVLETDDYSDLEKYLFHKKIEDRNRDVNRIYDLKQQQDLEYLSNPLFSDRNIGFRIEYKNRIKSEIKLNFKNIFAFTDFNKKHLIGLSLKGVFLGVDVNNKGLFLGYKKK